MGNSCGIVARSRSLTILRQSMLGAMMSEEDLRRFYSVCHREKIFCKSSPTTASNFPPNPTIPTSSSGNGGGRLADLKICPEIALYLIISGTVEVYLSNNTTQRPVLMTTFGPSEIIFLLPGLNALDGNLRFGENVLTYHVRPEKNKRHVRLLTITKDAFNNFLVDRLYLEDLVHVCLVKDAVQFLLDSPTFRSLNRYQMQMVLMLMKFRYLRRGQLVRTSPPACGGVDTSLSLCDPSFTKAQLPAETFGILLKGACAYLPPGTDFSALPLPSVPTRSTEPQTVNSRNSTTQKYFYRPPSVNDMNSSWQHNTIYAGSTFGLEQYFIHRNPLPSDHILCLEASIVPFLSISTLHSLCCMDVSLRRKLRGNYNRHIFDTVRAAVPLLADLEESMYGRFCSRVLMRGFDSNTTIFRQGEKSEFSYILLHGLVREETLSEPGERSSPLAGVVANGLTIQTAQVRYLAPLSLFGEVALLTHAPYFSTTVSMEPMIAICIGQRTLDLLFQKDEAKLTEVKIKLSQPERLPLSLLLAHHDGNQSFLRFATSEHGEENVLFYNAVTTFEQMAEKFMGKLLASNEDIWQQLHDHNLELLCHPSAATTAGMTPHILGVPPKHSAILNVSVNAADFEAAASATAAQILSSPIGSPVPCSSPSSSSNLVTGNLTLGLSKQSLSRALSSRFASISEASIGTNCSWKFSIQDKHGQELQDSLLSQLHDLRSLVKHIAENHLQRDGPLEVNIEDKVRTETLQACQAFLQRNPCGLLASLMANLLNQPTTKSALDSPSKLVEEQEMEKEGEGEGEFDTVSTLKHLHLPRADDLATLFVASKQAVYLLMARDTYMRFKHSPLFQSFVGRFQFYANQRPSVAESSEIRSSVCSSSNATPKNRKLLNREDSVFQALMMSNNSLQNAAGGSRRHGLQMYVLQAGNEMPMDTSSKSVSYNQQHQQQQMRLKAKANQNDHNHNHHNGHLASPLAFLLQRKQQVFPSA